LRCPDLVREVLTDPKGILPRSDLMVHALDPLIGDSIFVSLAPPRVPAGHD
jgi:hypothetical protein